MCMRAHELLKSGSLVPGWHYVTQSIIGLLVDELYYRIDSEIEDTLRRFCRDKDLQKSSSRRSQVSDSQKTSEKYLEVSPWEFRESFRRFETISFTISHKGC